MAVLVQVGVTIQLAGLEIRREPRCGSTRERHPAVRMSEWPALMSWSVGGVHEAVVTGTNAHPLHIHVNPFQITAMPSASYYNDYFMTGDWHDTLMIPDFSGSDAVTVRMNTDSFTGKVVVHCHILEHEDEGNI